MQSTQPNRLGRNASGRVLGGKHDEYLSSILSSLDLSFLSLQT